jgi:hypothetical protein
MKSWKFVTLLAAICAIGIAGGCNNEDEAEVTPDASYEATDPATDADTVDPEAEPDVSGSIVDPGDTTPPDPNVPDTNAPPATGADSGASTTDTVDEPAVREEPATDVPEKLEEGAESPPPNE